MKRPTFLADDVISVGGIEITIDGPGNYERLKDDDTVLYMAKGLGQIEAYLALAGSLAEDHPVGGILELGVFRGGSAVFLDQVFEPTRLVCVDREEAPIPLLEEYRATRSHVSTHYGVEQSDRDTLLDICRTEFPDGIDLVVDDASHFYEESRASFEVVFPLLRPGGVYLIEDWSWAHDSGLSQSPEHHWAGKAALTNLLIELLTAHGTDSAAFRELRCVVGFAYVVRGPAVLPVDGSFRLDDHILTRGLELPRI